MFKILLPVDGSENALRAAHYAVSLARDEEARTKSAVYVVTVQLEPVIYGEAALYIDYRRLEEAQRLQAEDVLKPVRELLSHAGIRHEAEVLRGDVAATIVRRAEERGCDAIVMGTRGLGAIASLVLGSTALKVVHLTKIPVTLVK